MSHVGEIVAHGAGVPGMPRVASGKPVRVYLQHVALLVVNFKRKRWTENIIKYVLRFVCFERKKNTFRQTYTLLFSAKNQYIAPLARKSESVQAAEK